MDLQPGICDGILNLLVGTVPLFVGLVAGLAVGLVVGLLVALLVGLAVGLAVVEETTRNELEKSK